MTLTLTVTALVDAIAADLEPGTMAQDLDRARTAAHQQTIEREQERVRAKARELIRRVWEWQVERAEASRSPFKAALARAYIADLDREGKAA